MDWEYFKENNKWLWLFILGNGLCLISTISFFAGFHVIFEMAASFRVHYFLLLFFVSIPFFKTKRYKTASAFLLFSFINFSQFGSLYWINTTNHIASWQEKIISFNVHSANKDYQKTIDFIEEENPDYISLIEVTPDWEEAILHKLKDKYPHYISQPRRDNFGIMFLSKKPFTGMIHIHERVPYIQADIDHSIKKFSIFTIHPIPPLNQSFFRERARFSEDLINKVNLADANILVCGDFNMTPWSPQFKHLVKKTGLRNSSEGYGISTSWPAGMWFLRIPIDHCLISPKGFIPDRKIGPNLGSDHLPLIINFGF